MDIILPLLTTFSLEWVNIHVGFLIAFSFHIHKITPLKQV
jgi:hypothetical protein